nr:methyltransferase domain-containing protein [Methylobacterium brachythecii]
MPDGSSTFPEAGGLLSDEGWAKAAIRCLEFLYRANLKGRRIADLGCLEGGYTAEFARLGLDALGIEVRQNNYDNCLLVQKSLGLPNISFVKDDVLNIKTHGMFDVIFCCGLLYHLQNPVQFIDAMSAQARDAVIINTHYAPEEGGEQFNLSSMTENEGMRGRWFFEHDAKNVEELESLKWAAWSNTKSFWLTKPSLFQCLHNAGFDMVFEQIDHISPNIKNSMEAGYYASNFRSMFVGVRTSSFL